MNIYSVGIAIASSHVGGQHDVMWNALYHVDGGGGGGGGIEISWGTVEYTLLEYDITRRDPLSVVMDAGSCIVKFIHDGAAFG